jgi:hypothetical protein
MKTPTMRFKFEGHWWRVKIQRPPTKELCEGLCDYDSRTIFLHPQAVKVNGLGIVVHEIAHALLRPVNEDHVLELERVVSAVALFTAKHTGGTISIGNHDRA